MQSTMRFMTDSQIAELREGVATFLSGGVSSCSTPGCLDGWPEHPVFALATALGMDMLSGRAVKACPEAMQANALGAQFLSEAYGLPLYTAGLTSDSFCADGQAMVEHSLYGLMFAAAGSSSERRRSRGSPFRSPGRWSASWPARIGP